MHCYQCHHPLRMTLSGAFIVYRSRMGGLRHLTFCDSNCLQQAEENKLAVQGDTYPASLVSARLTTGGFR